MADTQEVAVVILTDSDGEYFIHQRRQDKRLFPSLWGVGAGGKVEPGESADDAATRELWEEAGCAPHLQHCFNLTYDGDLVTTNMRVYEAKVKREDVGFDDTEWQTSRWVTKDELKDLASQNEVLCPDTAAFVRKYFGLVSA